MKNRLVTFSLLVKVTTTVVILGFHQSNPTVFGANVPETRTKLLIIMLDGFRWDYYNQHKSSLKAFQQFLSEGVQAEYVDSVFPSLSFPSWTTISTGVFPETHGILGNYMFDLNESDPNKALFSFNDLETTKSPKWWQNCEPIWTSATKHDKKTFVRLWSRADVPFHGAISKDFSGYHSAPGMESISVTFDIAVQKLKEDYELVMIYGEHIDNVGHRFGPNSPQLKEALVDVDKALNDLLDKLIDSELDEKVNIIIVSDHGMAWAGRGSGVKYINMDDYLVADEIYRSIQSETTMSIQPLPEHYQTVLDRLEAVPGINFYKREEMPDEYHYKNARLALDILVVAKENYYIRGLQSDAQIPRDANPNAVSNGIHGYFNTEDMRTIFFAKGPAFKKGIVHPPIRLEDEYQIFAKLLDIPAQPHNGSWIRVENMLSSGVIQVPSRFLIPVLLNLAFLFICIGL